jgi:hypothetical protein
MQKTILTILIICNLSVGVEVATDYDDAWPDFGGTAFAADILAGLADGNTDPDAETDCDHCCHGVAHFAGIVAASATLPYLHAASAIPHLDTPTNFTNPSPPTPPPNV